MGLTSKSFCGKLIELGTSYKTLVGKTLHVVKDIDKDGKNEYKIQEWNTLDNERLFKK
jgi:hypothetical protein